MWFTFAQRLRRPKMIKKTYIYSHSVGEWINKWIQNDEKSLASKEIFDKKGKRKFWKKEVEKGHIRMI